MSELNRDAVCRLIVFTRYPTPGQCKTRLVPAIGADAACRLQRRLTEYVVAEARKVQEAGEARVEICYAGAQEDRVRRWLGEDLLYRPQIDGDLGARMLAPLGAAIAQAAASALLVGCDIPDLDAAHMRQAIGLLRQAPVVLTPTRDGGFCLIGAAGALPDLPEIDWGSDRVLTQTLARIDAAGLNWRLTEALTDLDTQEDLEDLRPSLLRRLGPEALPTAR
jgi:rSAM/selenodomain-associated transferase 1